MLKLTLKSSSVTRSRAVARAMRCCVQSSFSAAIAPGAARTTIVKIAAGLEISAAALLETARL